MNEQQRTLSAKAQQLVQLLEERDQKEQAKESQKDFESLTSELRRQNQLLKEAVSGLALLREVEAYDKESLPSPTELLGTVESIRQKTTDGAQSSLIKKDRLFRNLVQALGVLGKDLELRLNGSWHSLVERRKPTMRDESLQLWSSLGVDQSLLGSINILRMELDALSKAPPRKKVQMDRFFELASSLMDAYGKINSLNLPPEVELFLRKATNHDGIPLSSLTPEVAKWLKEQGLDRKFIVRVASSLAKG